MIEYKPFRLYDAPKIMYKFKMYRFLAVLQIILYLS